VSYLFKFLRRHYWALSLIILSLAVSAANYQAGTWLLGWDNLVPEFNWQLNISRAVSSAWQEYQGLGLAGGMAHGASLSRELILWLLSPIIPQAFTRYFWTFLMLVIGPLGTYFFFDTFLRIKNRSLSKQAAFVAGLFYLFNLATVQYFYTPFETFISFYGFLPWLLWATLRLLKIGSRRTKLIYFLLSLAATSAWQVQTMFVVYGLIAAVFILETWFKDGWSAKEKIISWLGLTLLANAFWLIPVAYFTLFHSSVNLLAKQNQLATPELRVMNRNFGGLADITAFKGYWFEYLDRSLTGGHRYLLEPWRDYLSYPLMTPLLRLLFVGGLGGLFWTAFHHFRRYYRWSFFALAVGTILILTSGFGELGKLYVWLEQHLPLFEQIFRTTFTKWSIVMAWLIALGLGVTFSVVAKKIAKRQRKWLFLGFCAAILSISPPYFKGQLIYDRMQVELPQEYLELFEFFEERPKQARVAVLPAEKIFSWDFHDWGYRGSGFLWYGIKQPILDRAFDVFSAENETFYHQLAEAWQNGTPAEVATVLKRYDVGYVLLDESTLYASSKPGEMLALARQVLEDSGCSEIWQRDFLTVFEYPNIAHQDFISTPNQVELVKLIDGFQARREFLIAPQAFISPKQTSEFFSRTKIMPLASLTKQELSGFKRRDNQLVFTQPVFTLPDLNYTLSLPALSPGDIYYAPTTLSLQDNKLTVSFHPLGEIKLGEQSLRLPTLGTYILELSGSVNRVLFETADQSISLSQGESERLTLPLTIGQSIGLSANEVLGDASQGGVLIKTANRQRFTVPEAVWQRFTDPQDYHLVGNGQAYFELTLPTVAIDLLPLFRELSDLRNCDVFNRGEIDKEILANDSILYTAKNSASFCENLGIGDVAAGTSYLLQVVGENLSGRSLKISFSGSANNFFYLESLADDEQFEHAYAILPQVNPEKAYFLNLENRSFGKDISQNKIDQLVALQLPIDYEALSQLALVPEGYQSLTNFTKLTDTHQWGTGFYWLTAEVQADEGVIVLHQGYNSGWLAIKLNGWPKILEQFEFNDWANAWLLPSGKNLVFIFYWPQLAVFAGLLAAIGAGVRLVKRR
jgi:hypothetical protein